MISVFDEVYDEDTKRRAEAFKRQQAEEFAEISRRARERDALLTDAEREARDKELAEIREYNAASSSEKTAILRRRREARRAAEAAAEAAARAAAEQKPVEPPDPWVEQLRNIKGRIDPTDGVERISTLFIMEFLGVKPHKRLSEFKRLQKVMVNSLGWQPTRVFGLNERSYREQLRGFARIVETDKKHHGRFRLAAADADEQSAVGGSPS